VKLLLVNERPREREYKRRLCAEMLDRRESKRLDQGDAKHPPQDYIRRRSKDMSTSLGEVVCPTEESHLGCQKVATRAMLTRLPRIHLPGFGRSGYAFSANQQVQWQTLLQ
jgi:hypothetical protein